MREQADDLLPVFQKINAILGFGIAIAPDALSEKISSVIDSERLESTRLLLSTPPFETVPTHNRGGWR